MSGSDNQSGGGTGGPGRALARLSPLLSLATVVALFALLAPGAPLSALDLRTIAVHTMIVGTCALGMTVVILGGGIDLSVGSLVALASVAAALAINGGAAPGLAVLVAVGAGAIGGLYNGSLIAGLGLPPFIVTLGTLGLFRGVSKWIAGSRPVSADVGWLANWVQPMPRPGWLLMAPGVWVMLALGVLTAGALRHTVVGRFAIATGSNPEAARRCGVPVRRVRLLVYTLAGALAGLAGAMQLARLTQGDPTVAIGLELEVIAAVVIGGASLSGGTGSIAGTIAGATLMAFLRNRSAALGWPTYVQEIIVGHIILVAVGVDRWRAGRRSRTGGSA